MNTIISENDFEQTYRPLTAPSGAEGDEVWEYAETLEVPINRVWTLIDGDEDDNTYAAAGYHLVNKIGYVVTERPWLSGDELALWFERAGESA